MPRLYEIAAGTISGVAPTPVERYAMETYFVNDALFNIMPFKLCGMGTGYGNFVVTYTLYNELTTGASFRGLGKEYNPDNAEPIPKTVYLKPLGGSFENDRMTTRALSSQGIDIFREQQIAQKANSIKNGFLTYFLNGKVATDPKQFDGVFVALDEFSDQVLVDTLSLEGGLSTSNAILVEQHFNECIGLMNRPANVVITTRKGAALLKTLNAYRNMYTGPIEIDSIKYEQYMGIPIVVAPDTSFKSTYPEIDFVFAYLNENDGIYTAIPIDGKVIDIVDPELGDGTMVKTGALEMVSAPIFYNPKAFAHCTITITAPEVQIG